MIFTDNHLRGCTMRINNYLGDKFRTIDRIKPGALAELEEM
jgi:hypothetical protein